jgi:tRNA threonylcarbamoyladenosine biosynthesis protein TsaB
MRVLGLTTSTPRGGAAVSVDGAITGASAYVDLQGHAERIFEAIDQALAEARLARGDLDAIACDVGPGSFTGVRVGVASSKGIALALDVPIIGVGSLEAIAEAAFDGGALGATDLCYAAIDAKKDELFVAVYDRALTAILAPALVARTGEAAAALVRDLDASRLHRLGDWPGAVEPVFPDPRSIARLGSARIDAGGEVEPIYVRAPDAKLPGSP